MKQLSSLLLVIMPLVACAGTFEEARIVGMKERAPHVAGSSSRARDDVYCRGKDDQASTWSAVSVGAGSLAGASGLSAIPMADKTTRVVLSVVGVVAAAGAVGAAVVSKSASSAWARECAGPP